MAEARFGQRRLHRSTRNICRLLQSNLQKRVRRGVAVGPSKRRPTIDFALISLVANLAHEQRNPFLPIHSNIHGIIMMAEKACESCVCGRKGHEQKSTALSFERTHQEVPFSWDLLASETTSFVFPSVRRRATSVVVGVNVRAYT